MQIGQTYKIPVLYGKHKDNGKDKFRIVDGVLVQITRYLYVFDYKDRQGNILRNSIRKIDWIRMHTKARNNNG